jgi:hypothetical protein
MPVFTRCARASLLGFYVLSACLSMSNISILRSKSLKSVAILAPKDGCRISSRLELEQLKSQVANDDKVDELRDDLIRESRLD